MPQEKMDVRVSLVTTAEEHAAALKNPDVVFASDMLIVSISEK